MRTIVGLIALLALVLVGAVAAQSSGHGVAVTIPEVLRLRVDPDARGLEVFAGGRWQLSASYAPAGDGTGSTPPASSPNPRSSANDRATRSDASASRKT